MADTPINLNRARKARARSAAKQEADANSEKFGRNKAEKARDSASISRLAAHLDAHRKDDSKDTP